MQNISLFQQLQVSSAKKFDIPIILPQCRLLAAAFGDSMGVSHIQIPSGAVLPASLRCRETRKKRAPFAVEKQKAGAGAASMTVPTPALAGDYLY